MHAIQTRRTPTVLIAGGVALAMVVALVVRTSQAAFTADVDNPNNTFSAATISLSANYSTPMFELEDLVPGETHTRCIEITYAGPVSATSPDFVKLYGDGGGGTLAGVLELSVDRYAAGQTCATATPTPTNTFDGTLATFASLTNYGNGATSWKPTDADRTRAFRFSVGIAPTAVNADMNATAQHTFTWEIQS
jgi:hypothetical protein